MAKGTSGNGHNGPRTPKPGIPKRRPALETGSIAPRCPGTESFPWPLPATVGSESSAGASPRRPADLVDLRPDGGLRPPDYRWQLARRLAAGEFVPWEWLDPWTLLAEEALTTPPGLAWNAPDLRAAGAARELAERGPYWRRVEVEARILAGETVEAVAAKVGLPTATVAAYAALFYDVAGRLTYPSYVIHSVIRLYMPGNESDIGVQARLLAFTGGRHVLDAVLDAAHPDARPDADVSAEDRELRKLTRLALGLRLTPVTRENAVTWARLNLLQRECRARGVK